MNKLRKTVGLAFFGGAMAAGFEREPSDMGIQTVGSGQTFEEPAAEIAAPTAIAAVLLNREVRRALGYPKGQFAAFVADHSIERTALEDSINAVHLSNTHRLQSTGNKNF